MLGEKHNTACDIVCVCRKLGRGTEDAGLLPASPIEVEEPHSRAEPEPIQVEE
jgi:hypothetical protein